MTVLWILIGMALVTVAIYAIGGHFFQDDEPLGGVSDWFKIDWDESAIHLDVRTSSPWSATIPWEEIERICIKMERDADLGVSNGLYIWVSRRENSYAIPFDGENGWELVKELPRRGFFSPKTIVQAMGTIEGEFYWPEEESC